MLKVHDKIMLYTSSVVAICVRLRTFLTVVLVSAHKQKFIKPLYAYSGSLKIQIGIKNVYNDAQ